MDVERIVKTAMSYQSKVYKFKKEIDHYML